MFKVTYGRKVNGILVQATQISNEGNSYEYEYSRVKAFVEGKIAELRKAFAY